MLLLTHILFSVFLGVMLFKADILFFSIMLIASIIPDLDIHIPFFKHRGFFHSIFAGALISLIFIFQSFSLSLAFLAGFCSHLLADSLTVAGTCPFWPSQYRTKFGFIRTGKLSEQIFFVVLMACILIRVLYILN